MDRALNTTGNRYNLQMIFSYLSLSGRRVVGSSNGAG